MSKTSSRGVGSVLTTLRSSGLRWTATLLLDRVLPFGALRFWSDVVVSREALAAQVTSIFCAWGMPVEHTAIAVEHLLYADLHGIESHGCGMLLHYHRELREGSLVMQPTIAVLRETATTALIDGGGGLGHVPADTAMKLAIEKCRESGIGAVAVRNSGHYGSAGTYASMAVREGFIGFATTNTRRPSVVPTFGAAAMLGTNPIAIAAPARRNEPFLLDMATSAASLGTVATAWRRGRSIPPGLAVRADGGAVTNPRRAVAERRLTPLGSSRELGGHKGYGLAVAMEMLSSVLSGGRRAAANGNNDVGHFFLALDPRRFLDEGEFENGLDELVDALRATTPLDPAEPVRVAGDPEHEAVRVRAAAGIPLTRSVVEDLRAVARAASVPFTLERKR